MASSLWFLRSPRHLLQNEQLLIDVFIVVFAAAVIVAIVDDVGR